MLILFFTNLFKINLISYLYPASGDKLKKTFGTSEPTYYQGSVLKINGNPVVLNPEGRAVWNSSTSKWEYEYDVKDHLGNIKASFAINEKVKVLQTRDYYPFGMEMASWYVNDANATKFRYNGKELQDEEVAGSSLGWYDYGHRMYDPALGRWYVSDPVAMAMPQWSTYAYSFNNPIRFTDPDGSIPYDKCADNTTKIGHYGMRTHPVYNTQKMHRGTDLTAKEGSSINSFASGTVVHVGTSSSWGNFVVVDHGQGYFSLYAHVKDDGTKVKKGQKVGDGEQIGEVGSTGVSTGPHLHMEVGKAKDKWAFLSAENRDETRTDAAEIGDLQKFLHPEEKEESSDEEAVKESKVRDEEGNVVGTRYENTGKNQAKWEEYVNKLLDGISNLENYY